MTNINQPTSRVVYADHEAVRQLYYDLKRAEVSDGAPGFSRVDTQAAADLLTQSIFKTEQFTIKLLPLFAPYKEQDPQYYVPKGTERTYIVPAPLISKRDLITAKILPRLMVDLEEIITRPNIQEQEGTQTDKETMPDRPGEFILHFRTGRLKITVTEAADAITLGAEKMRVGLDVFSPNTQSD
jgi:hypothetical protein